MADFPDSAPLRRLETLDEYRRLFTNVKFWEPYVRLACQKAHLRCEDVI